MNLITQQSLQMIMLSFQKIKMKNKLKQVSLIVDNCAGNIPSLDYFLKKTKNKKEKTSSVYHKGINKTIRQNHFFPATNSFDKHIE